MLRFRAILLWLMMLAVPFQAIAAGAMAACGPVSNLQTELSQATPDKGAHHAHHVTGERADQADLSAEMHHGGDASDQDDAVHTCGNCAPCHGIGLTPVIATPRMDGLPPADLAEPLSPVAVVSSPVLQKPPRA